MIIVIEGADLTGKSTLIRRLCEEIENTIPIKLKPVIDMDHKNVADIEKAINYTAYSVMNKVEDKIWIVDRFILSALIYSEFLNRPTKLSVEDIKKLDYHLIILGSSDDEIRKRFHQREEKHFKIEEIIKLNQLFFLFYLKTDLRNMYYYENNSQKDAVIMLNFIKTLIRTYYDR